MGIEITPDSGESRSLKVSSSDLGDAIRSFIHVLPSPKSQALSDVLQKDCGITFLLIDCSGTMQKNGKLEQVKDGALDLAQEAIKQGHSIGIIKFDTAASLLYKPGRNILDIKQILTNLQAGGFTNMVEALSLARQLLTGKSCYRRIIIITDGMPNGFGDPEASLKEALAARQDGIYINAIGTDDAKEEFLKQLTQ